VHTEALALSLRLRHPDAPRWRSRAFGLGLDLGFDAPPLPPVVDSRDRVESPATTVDLVYASSLRRAWPRAGARMTGIIGPPERPVVSVQEHPEAGYLIEIPPYGAYAVSADGTAVVCAPPRVAWWRWQRQLIAQALPAAAALRGYELLHASAVHAGGRTIAFAGTSGVGKSSLAFQFIRGGATLVAEDVLTLAERDGQVVAEPGSAMLNVAENEVADMSDLKARPNELARSEGKSHLLVAREERGTPLAAVYLLERDDGASPMFEDVEVVGPRDVFQNTFVNYIYRPERMLRQLELAALLARTVPVVRLRIRSTWGSARVADAIARHADAAT
jgi:hypothetical protein